MRKLYSLTMLVVFVAGWMASMACPAPQNNNPDGSSTPDQATSNDTPGQTSGCVGTTCQCVGDALCKANCPNAGCNITCGTSSECNANCAGGNCEIKCENTKKCDANCGGGNCNVDCASSPDCDVNCVGGGCKVKCADSQTCDVNCSQGNCNVECKGACKVVCPNCTVTCKDGSAAPLVVAAYTCQ